MCLSKRVLAKYSECICSIANVREEVELLDVVFLTIAKSCSYEGSFAAVLFVQYTPGCRRSATGRKYLVGSGSTCDLKRAVGKRGWKVLRIYENGAVP